MGDPPGKQGAVAHLPIPSILTNLQYDSASFGHSMIEAGQVAPDFVLESHGGRRVRLSDLKGSVVVLYFYPADDTPGCTKEACGFRDQFPDLGALDAIVLGVSPDGVDSHAKFAAKYSLPFELLADPDHAVASRYGAWGKKNMYGREFEGIIRSTWLIGRDGVVVKVWKRVKADGHAEQVLEALKSA